MTVSLMRGHIHKLLLGVKLLCAAFPVAIFLIDDFRLLLAFVFVPFLFYQGGFFWLFLLTLRPRAEEVFVGFDLGLLVVNQVTSAAYHRLTHGFVLI